jgi:hypothetical protein
VLTTRFDDAFRYARQLHQSQMHKGIRAASGRYCRFLSGCAQAPDRVAPSEGIRAFPYSEKFRMFTRCHVTIEP